jgi:hypothetical protein
MKTQFLFKVLLVLPLILFVDWILMVVLGCASGLCGFGNSFYCGPYCLFGKGILLLSAVSFLVYLLFPEIKKTIINKKHAPAN